MNTTKRVKSVGFAYPSSDTAKRFGKEKSGCWVVHVGKVGEPAEAITAHAERESALKHAHALSMDWDASFVTIYPEDAAKYQPFVLAR